MVSIRRRRAFGAWDHKTCKLFGGLKDSDQHAARLGFPAFWTSFLPPSGEKPSSRLMNSSGFTFPSNPSALAPSPAHWPGPMNSSVKKYFRAWPARIGLEMLNIRVLKSEVSVLAVCFGVLVRHRRR